MGQQITPEHEGLKRIRRLLEEAPADKPDGDKGSSAMTITVEKKATTIFDDVLRVPSSNGMDKYKTDFLAQSDTQRILRLVAEAPTDDRRR